MAITEKHLLSCLGLKANTLVEKFPLESAGLSLLLRGCVVWPYHQIHSRIIVDTLSFQQKDSLIRILLHTGLRVHYVVEILCSRDEESGKFSTFLNEHRVSQSNSGVTSGLVVRRGKVPRGVGALQSHCLA